MRDPLKESTSCFLTRLSPMVLVPIGLFHRTQSPRWYLSYDSKSLILPFIGLKVLCLYAFIALKVLYHFLFKDYHSLLSCNDNQGHPILYFSKTIIVFCLAETFKVIYSITFQKTTMSSIIYGFKRRQCLHLHFEDDNVFSHLLFQKETMTSFTFQKMTISSVIYAFKRRQCLHLHFEDDNVFSHLWFQKATMPSFTF